MYKECEKIITAEGMTIELNCETSATRRHRTNYYFDCSKCARQSIGDDTGTQWDCNNYSEVEAYKTTPKGCAKIYCANYKRANTITMAGMMRNFSATAPVPPIAKAYTYRNKRELRKLIKDAIKGKL